MKMTCIKLIDDFQRLDLIGVNHHYYEFNKVESQNEILLFLNLHEHYNNVELFKVALFCRKHNHRLVVYSHLNELPLVSTFADAGIFYSRDDHNIYEGISKYKYDLGLVGGLFNESLTHAARQVWSLSRVYGKTPLLLDLIDKEISDEEVVENFSFPTICIRKSAYEKYQILQNMDVIKDNLVICEVKDAKDCGGPSLLENLKEKSKGFALDIKTDMEFNRNMFGLCGQDYMGVQILSSFLNNWMWILYGGSCNIFPFFPVKILSMSDQTIIPSLNRKMSVARFGEMGEVFPEFETLIYCLPGEADGPSRTDGHKPLPNYQDQILNFSKLNNKYLIKF